MPSPSPVLRGLPSLLDRLDLSQAKFSRGVGVTPETVSRWLNGHVTPGASSLVKTLAFLRQHDPTITFDDIVNAA